MLSLVEISAHYGQIQALRSISLDVNMGEIVAVIGSNGAGKTTLMNTVSGVVPARAGTIGYELLAGMTARLPRVYRDEDPDPEARS